MPGKRTRSNRKSKSQTATRVRRGLSDFRPVLEGEDAALYDDIVARMYEEVKPVDVVDEMYLADVAYLQWDLPRWHRHKFHLMEASFHKELRSLLKRRIEYSLYKETFAELLADILRESLQKNLSEERARELAEQCANCQQEATNQVNSLLTTINLNITRVLGDARDQTASELMLDYARRKPNTVKLVDDLVASDGSGRDDVLFAMLSTKFDEIERIDHKIAIVEARRNVTLREIDRRRAVLGEALRRTLPKVEGEFETTTPEEENSTRCG